MTSLTQPNMQPWQQHIRHLQVRMQMRVGAGRQRGQVGLPEKRDASTLGSQAEQWLVGGCRSVMQRVENFEDAANNRLP